MCFYNCQTFNHVVGCSYIVSHQPFQENVQKSDKLQSDFSNKSDGFLFEMFFLKILYVQMKIPQCANKNAIGILALILGFSGFRVILYLHTYLGCAKLYCNQGSTQKLPQNLETLKPMQKYIV